MMDQDLQLDAYGCKCDSEKVIFCFDKRTEDYTWSCSGHCFEQVPSHTVATQTSEQYLTAMKSKTTSCSKTQGTETDIYGIDRNEELVSLLKEALEVCTQRKKSHPAVSQDGALNQSYTKHVDIEKSRKNEKQEGIEDVSFGEKYNRVDSISNEEHFKQLYDNKDEDDDDFGEASPIADNHHDGQDRVCVTAESSYDHHDKYVDDTGVKDNHGDHVISGNDDDDGVVDEGIAIQIDRNDDDGDGGVVDEGIAIQIDRNDDDGDDDEGSEEQLDDDNDVDYIVDDTDDDTDEDESNISHYSGDISNPPTKDKQPEISSKNKHKNKGSFSREVFPCSYCTRKCTTKSLFEKHIQWHERSKETKCNICGKEFSKPGYLINHQEKHQVVRKQGTENPLNKQLNLAECRHCGKLVKKKRLAGHEKTHGAPPRQKKTLVCSYCGKTFTSPKDFARHVRTHTKEKPYKCDRCESAFYCNTELTIHIRRHEGDKRYKCDHCGKAFVRKCNLDDHLRTHTGARPYKCDYCDKSFGFRNVLKVHIVRHTGMWPHVCEYCEKGFAKKCFLNKHLMTHTGVKPYKCLKCKETFIDKASLTLHAQIHLV